MTLPLTHTNIFRGKFCVTKNGYLFRIAVSGGRTSKHCILLCSCFLLIIFLKYECCLMFFHLYFLILHFIMPLVYQSSVTSCHHYCCNHQIYITSCITSLFLILQDYIQFLLNYFTCISYKYKE